MVTWLSRFLLPAVVDTLNQEAANLGPPAGVVAPDRRVVGLSPDPCAAPANVPLSKTLSSKLRLWLVQTIQDQLVVLHLRPPRS